MADGGYYKVPILESASGYESSHSVVFGGKVSRESVLDTLGLTFESIRHTSEASASQAVRSVYEDNFHEYQSQSGA
jgi:hypothetical protein